MIKANLILVKEGPTFFGPNVYCDQNDTGVDDDDKSCCVQAHCTQTVRVGKELVLIYMRLRNCPAAVAPVLLTFLATFYF